MSGTRVVLEAPATIAWAPSRIAVDGLSLRAGQGARARLSGSLGDTPASGPLRLTVESPLSELLALAGPVLPDGVGLTADGSFSADLGIGGTLRAPSPSGTLALRAARVVHGDLPPATDLVVEARVEPSQIVLQTLAASWQQAAVSASGAMPWRLLAQALAEADSSKTDGWASQWLASLPPAPRTARLAARATGITPEVLIPFASAEAIRDVTGAMALTLTAEADALSLERTRASVVVDEASFTLAGVGFKQTEPTRIGLENGRARIDAFRWDSLGNPLVVSGGVNLAEATPRLDLGVDGTLDLRVLGAFAAGVGAGGTARVNLAIGGAIASPDVTGEIVLADGELRVDAPRLLASDVAGTVRIAADRTAVIAVTGTINGGAAKIDGRVDLTRPDDPRGTVTLDARNVAVEYPEGFQTESNAQLTLALASPGPTLSGRIDVLGGTYREPLVVTGQLLEGLQQSGIATAADASGLLSTLRLDLAVATREAIRIDNNYGRLAIAGSLRVTGTPDRPGLVGRLEAEPDGELFLAGNTYRVERLVVDFANPNAMAPDLSFLAQTRVGNVPMDVGLECAAAGPCERQVRSLASGVTDEEAEAQLFGVPANAAAAGEQLARLLSGDLLGLVSRTVGLDTLRLEQGARGNADIFDDPTLVAGDVDPASRLTLGKRLGENVELAYSQNLTESGFTWSTTYHAPYGLSARVLLLDDQSRSYEFRHEPRPGERPSAARPPRRPRPRVTEVRIGGNPGFPERELRRRLRLSAGKRFEFAAWQRDRDRLAGLYHARGFREARIRARRLPAVGGGTPAPTAAQAPLDPDEVVLEYVIEQGPETRLEVRGVTLPDEVRDRILERWSSALFDGFLERDAATIVRSHLYREGFVHAAIDATVDRDAASGVKTLHVTVTPGPTPSRRLEFAGNESVASARLQEAAAATGTLTAWLAPQSFAQAIERFYRDEGFLSARVEVAAPDLVSGVSTVRATVREGPPFLVGEVGLSGAQALPEDATRKALDVFTGLPYRPTVLAEGVARVDTLFREAGFLTAATTVDTVVRPQDARVDVKVVVNSGPRSILREVFVEGGDGARPLLARAITLEPGAPIDPAALGATRRQLYDTGVYRRVDIDLQPVDPGTPSSAGSAPVESRAVDAHIRLLERPRYRFRYGLAFNDDVVGPEERDRRFGLAADLENRNLFGLGANAGVSTRLRRDQQVGRLFLGANRFFGLPLRSNVFLERRREAMNTEGAFPIVATITDLSAEQAYRIRRRVELRYGYALGRNRTVIEGQDFDLTVRVARLTSTGLVDRRSDPFDPDRGWFASSSLELSRPSLGSDISFLKGFVQYFQFQPLPRGMVLASAVRLGLARTFEGEVLIPTERFFSGGATSVRGYREEDLGPRSSFDDADGGQALLVVNGELRFPVYRWLRGVGFVDLGNVYPAVGEISLTDVQVGIGAGARIQSPVGLFRVDLGVPANRRPFDPKWKLSFGLGHTF